MKNNPHYAPENLLNMLRQLLGIGNDAQLAYRLGVEPSQICKIRHGKGVVSSAFLINAHEETNLSIAVLRGLMGDYRESTAASAKHPVEPPLHCLHQLHHPSMLPAYARVSIAARTPRQQHHP